MAHRWQHSLHAAELAPLDSANGGTSVFERKSAAVFDFSSRLVTEMKGASPSLINGSPEWMRRTVAEDDGVRYLLVEVGTAQAMSAFPAEFEERFSW